MLYIKNGKISLQNVSFSYNKFSPPTLVSIRLNIEAGEKIAIVGKSGSGKSTLLKILGGMHQPTSGELKVDGFDVYQHNKKDYRKQIGIVMQESILFNGTIEENLLMGRKIDKVDLIKAIKNADLESFINAFPLKMKTIISEEGKNISGGQRQRISICRSIIGSPKIILLDEPTSSLDNLSENKIMNNLFTIDSTLVVVAHRLSNIGKFDKVILMDQGRIIAVDEHEKLLKSCIPYQELYLKTC
ncbi:MAG: ATP-binding cassette domain-containing protein [Lactobacillales bacterium]|jgi:subfamily B ATP-binding cassette protein MsbA|nr:ATP-binding cassette domain-containing protein [Lactobacillales bacterium]